MPTSLRTTAILLLLIAPAAGADQPLKPPASSPGGVAEIVAEHDRAVVAELTAYLKKNPKAADAEQGYMTLFNKAIDHDWFAETEPIARAYLAANPSGAVRSLAQIVAAMADAGQGKFGSSLILYKELLRGLDRPEQEEFAVTFADTLAAVAMSAGEYGAARKIYEAILARFEESPTLRKKVGDDLARLDRVGKPAPKFEVHDLAGKAVRLADLKGKYVLVDFWATWCAPCLAELPNLQAAYDKYHDRGFEVVAVSLDETAGPVADFVRARKVPWAQVHNASCGGDMVEAFGVGSIPATFLVDPDGIITRLELRGPALGRALGTLIK